MLRKRLLEIPSVEQLKLQMQMTHFAFTDLPTSLHIMQSYPNGLIGSRYSLDHDLISRIPQRLITSTFGFGL